MKKLFVVKLAVAALLALSSFSVAQETAQKVDTPTPDVVADQVVAEAQKSVSDNVLVEGEVVAPVEPVSDDVSVGSPLPMTSDCIGCGQVAPFATGCVGCSQGVAPMMSGCVGCGQVGTTLLNRPMTPVLNRGCRTCTSCNTGCATACNTGCATACNTGCATRCNTGLLARRNVGCNTGCNTCGSVASYDQPVATVTYVQPMTTGCCGQVAQVTYNAPIQEPEVASSVIAQTPVASTPVAEAPVATPTTTYAMPVQGCTNCGPTTTMGTATAGPVATVAACNNCGPRFRGRLRGRVFRNR